MKFNKKTSLLLPFFLILSGFSHAQEKINSLEDLKKLQSQVKEVVAKNMEVTVSVFTSRGGSGSGVIVSEEGLILTAAHVVEKSETVDIIFPDGKTQKAKVLGYNKSKDIAMCEMVDKGPWKFAELRESSDLKIGEYMVAMGHAGGFDAVRTPPVRFGRVLAKRTNYFVTTDCTLIGGDSGGPLYDLEGKVVAIHSNIGNDWKINNHAGVSGFKVDWERMKKSERWGKLSVNPMWNPDSPAMGIAMGRSIAGGVFIADAFADGAAAKAGIKKGDIILKFNGAKVPTSDVLVDKILKQNAGDKVSVTIRRGDNIFRHELVLGRREELPNQRR